MGFSPQKFTSMPGVHSYWIGAINANFDQVLRSAIALNASFFLMPNEWWDSTWLTHILPKDSDPYSSKGKTGNGT
jgi:hypothetical protein